MRHGGSQAAVEEAWGWGVVARLEMRRKRGGALTRGLLRGLVERPEDAPLMDRDLPGDRNAAGWTEREREHRVRTVKKRKNEREGGRKKER